MVQRFLLLFSVLFISVSSFADLVDGYQDLSALQKQEILLNNIMAERWEQLPPLGGQGWSSIFTSLKSACNLGKTFKRESDEFEAEKPKLFHPYGMAAGFRMDSLSKKYTGLFSSGAVGILRLSLAADPKSIESFAPGMAMKFLVDGQPSQNLMVMYSLSGQGDNTDWFANSFSNKIPIPASLRLRAFLWLFSWVHDPSNVLPIKHLAAMDAHGNKVEQINVPDQLIFQPSDDVRGLIPSDSENDFRVDLATLLPGTTLYYVMAKNDNSDELEHIGNIVLTSNLFASRYADKRLFFKHHH